MIYDLHEGRFIQGTTFTSAGDALFAKVCGPVPNGKVWAILGLGYNPSVAETRVVFYAIGTNFGFNVPVTVPQSILLDTVAQFPGLTEGMEINLFPGETIYMFRTVATAGSTMTVTSRFIERDLPYYAYEEPLKKVIRVSQQHGSVSRAGGTAAQSVQSAGISAPAREGGKRGGGGEPI